MHEISLSFSGDSSDGCRQYSLSQYCEFEISETPRGNLLKLSKYIHMDSRMNAFKMFFCASSNVIVKVIFQDLLYFHELIFNVLLYFLNII